MVAVMDSKDEPFYIAEDLDDSVDRIYWKVLACPVPGCSEASFKKKSIRSFINPERLIDYLALHLNRSSNHDMNQQEAYDTAAAWVGMDENIEECTETFADRHEYREQVKHHHRKVPKAAIGARAPSRGWGGIVQQRKRGQGQHSKHAQRSQNFERSRSPPRDENRWVMPPLPPSHPPPARLLVNLPAPVALDIMRSKSKASIMPRHLPRKQTAFSIAGSAGGASSAGSAGETVEKSQFQLLHDSLTRAKGALSSASKACEALRRTFHDESDVIDGALATLNNLMER
jgi:hypothetical protein